MWESLTGIISVRLLRSCYYTPRGPPWITVTDIGSLFVPLRDFFGRVIMQGDLHGSGGGFGGVGRRRHSYGQFVHRRPLNNIGIPHSAPSVHHPSRNIWLLCRIKYQQFKCARINYSPPKNARPEMAQEQRKLAIKNIVFYPHTNPSQMLWLGFTIPPGRITWAK